MKGGWRYSAGRPGWRAKTSSCYRIDVQRWQRDGFLDGPRMFGWQWTNNWGDQSASISVRSHTPSPDVVTVQYRWRPHSADEWKPAEHRVSLTRTPGTLGGWRVWFRCPGCSRRAVHLYVTGRRLACRKCLNLAYPSQSEDVASRCHRWIYKIGKRLENRRLHENTKDRLFAKLEAAETRLDAEIAAHLSSLQGVDLWR